jgi:dTDP-4-amino-4,6-dideoxygalactose transaminase
MDEPGRHARSTHAYGMGWMYRTSDLPAALARSQLRRLDEIIRRARENYALFARLVADLPDAVHPFSSDERQTNGYAYPLRIDPAAAARRSVPAVKLRAAVVKALIAEGLPTIAPDWMLPAHTVFQAKNGYGEGCPWSCHLAGPQLDYDLAQFPIAKDCVDTALWFAGRDVQPLRPPNGPEEVELVADVVRKVFRSLDRLPV